jgi:hypothetical protein
MKDLKDILNEGLLDTPDRAIDEIEEEFNKIKEFVLDKKNWIRTGSSRTQMDIKINCKFPTPNILKLIDPKVNANYFQLTFYKSTMLKHYKGSWNSWGEKDYDIGWTKDHSYGSLPVNELAKTPPDVMKYYVKPLFKDLNTFVEELKRTAPKR